MTRRNVRLRTVALISVLAVLAAGCGGGGSSSEGSGATPGESGADAEATEPRRGGDLVVAMEAAWLPLDPLDMGALTDRTVGSAVYDTLVGVSPEGEFVPMLATSWDSEDGQSYDIVLREDVTFHDGTPLDADAVVKHFERLLDPANECRCQADLAVVESVTATGPLQVTIKLKAPSAAFPSVLSDVPGMIVSPTAAEALGEGFASSPVGAGPFKFVEQLENDHITFERYDGYWDDAKPYLDRITFRPIPDQQARYSSLRSGDVDLIVVPSVDNRVAAEGDPDLQVVELGGVGTQFTMFQTQQAPFDDVRARRAMAYATDVETLIETLYEGLYEPVRSVFPPKLFAASDPPNYPDYDLDEAKRLVEELGGLAFTFSVSNTPENLTLSQALQAMWEEAGMQVEIEVLEQTVLIRNALDHKFQAMGFRWAGRWDPDQNSWQFFRSGSPRNYTLLVDPEIDRLLDGARVETDQAKRTELYGAFSERLAELAPYSFLWSNDSAFIARSSVHDIPPLADWLLRPAGIWVEG